MCRQIRNKKKGFTLIEILVVIAITGVLAAVAVPSFIGFLREGDRIKNNNIARSLYLATQNEMSSMKRAEQWEEFIKKSNSVEVLSEALGESVKEEDKPYIHYIKLDKIEKEGEMDTSNPVYKLLDKSIIDRGLLYSSICIEFNIKTGVVFSVSYSRDLTLHYNDTEKDSMANLVLAENRKEGSHKVGYYGADNTGISTVGQPLLMIEIIDGVDVPLLGSELKKVEPLKDVLYVEAHVPKDTDQAYRIDLTYQKEGKESTFTYEMGAVNEITEKTLIDAIRKADAPMSTDSTLMYKTEGTKDGVEHGVRIGKESYERIVWILDIFSKNTNSFEQQKHSIAVKYSELEGDLSAKITQSDNPGQAADTPKKAHTLYNKEGTSLLGNKTYTIKTARHLNNVRNVVALESTQKFIQEEHVNMNEINMAPLTYHYAQPEGKLSDTENPFSKKYTVSRAKNPYKIQNLLIDDTTPKDRRIGLFGTVEKGTVEGAFLDKATIKSNTASNMGAIAGILLEGTIENCGIYAKIENNGINASNVGGIVGSVGDKGTVKASYNGGVALSEEEEENGSILVTGERKDKAVNIGGLVGRNAGSVESCYNNARVNLIAVDKIEVIPLDPNRKLYRLKVGTGSYADLQGAANIGGIVGINLSEGTLKKSYATNYVGKTTDEKSNTGGAIGNNQSTNGVENVFYIRNGLPAIGGSENINVDAKAVEKKELYNKKGACITDLGKGVFEYKAVEYKEGNHTAEDYPYPVLKANPHETPWEDIEEVYNSTAKLSYYELYADSSFGYYDGDTSTLPMDKIVIQDGYSIEFPYANKYEIMINDTKLILTDIRTEDGIPVWKLEKDGVAVTSVVESIGNQNYRLYLNNSEIEGLAKGNTDIKIEFLDGSKNILKRPLESDRVYFNSLFANEIRIGNAPVEKTAFAIRSPRQLDNVDRVLSAKYTQQLDLDFSLYYRELKMEESTIVVDVDKTMKKTESVVIGAFSGTYKGGDHYIRNVEVASIKEENSGFFSTISGSVTNIALIESKISGKQNVGGIAGKVDLMGSIDQCQLSNVVIQSEVDREKGSVGGVVGENLGTVTNIYFNSTYRDEWGLFASPILGKANKDLLVGGIIGANYGTLNNAYTTAIAPIGIKDNRYPTVGDANQKFEKNTYYLAVPGYNDDKSIVSVGTPKTPTELATIFKKDSLWEEAKLETTLFTEVCAGQVYPFPKIKGMKHYCDWPLLSIKLKYYEKYQDNTFGYYYYDEDMPINKLTTNEKNYAVEEGYLIEVIDGEEYTIKISNEEFPGKREIMDGVNVVKLSNEETEIAMRNLNYNKAVKIQAFKKGNQSNILPKNMYINPLFAKEIYLSATSDATPKSKMEIRSPRHMMNINRSSSTPSDQYYQTISIDFENYRTNVAVQPVVVGKNVVREFNGTYDGNNYAIRNLTMNVPDHEKNTENTGSAFGNNGDKGIIQNIEFVNPQIRYEGNGNGGGIVANVNRGTIDHIKVYNDQDINRSLFATTDTKPKNIFSKLLTKENNSEETSFCENTGLQAHNHGGIAGSSTVKSKITNCTVGTIGTKTSETYDNPTKILCSVEELQRGKDASDKEIPTKTSYIGGIVGQTSNTASVIACTNIAMIEAAYGGIFEVSLDGTSKEDKEGNPTNAYGVAGIAGGMTGGNRIIGCYNAGSIKSIIGWVAGISAVTYWDEGKKIDRCYNTGRINVEYDVEGNLIQILPVDKTTIRIGSIMAEARAGKDNIGLTMTNCYNIGYISGELGNHHANSTAGAVLGMSAYGRTDMGNCYSLKADQYKAKGVVGTLFSGGNINGMTPMTSEEFKKWEADSWKTKTQLRGVTNLTIPPSATEPAPYKVDETSAYIYPQLLNEFKVDDISYTNPHATPWEQIDAEYDSTLKYYEKYQDQTFGYYSLDVAGIKLESTLSNEKIVVKEGYYLEVGKPDTYRVSINGVETNIETIVMDGKTMIPIPTPQEGFKIGYNKIRVFTNMPGTSEEIIEANQINRIIGTTSLGEEDVGRDLYFDPMFPREIQYSAAEIIPKKPIKDAYGIRSVSQLQSIGKLTQIKSEENPVINATINKYFRQELNIEFPILTLSEVPVQGEFQGTFDGNRKVISNMTLGISEKDDIALFATNNGQIKNITMKGLMNISGGERVGTIVGTNKEEGSVENCVIEGRTNPITITGKDWVGGLVGLNQGSIKKCTVDTLAIHGTGTQVGVFFGANENEDEEAVTENESKDIIFDPRNTLRKSIVEIQSIHDKAREGAAKGEYPLGSKAILQEAIRIARIVSENLISTEEELKVAKETLEAATQVFRDGEIKGGA